MQRFLLRTLLLALAAFATLHGLAWLGEAVPKSIPPVERIEVGSAQTDLDALFIGSSRTYSAVDTPWLTSQGVRAFNLGTPTAGTYFYELIYDHYRAVSGSVPRRVFFEVSPWTLATSSDKWRKHPLHEHLSTPLRDPSVTERGEAEPYLAQLAESAQLAVPRVTNFAFNSSDINTQLARTRAAQLSSRGFAPSDKHLRKPPAPGSPKDRFDPDKLLRLRALIERAQADGARVSILVVPSFAPLASEGDRTNFVRALDVLEEAGVQVIRPEVEIPLEAWGDVAHMNARGAALFTRALFEKL